jgi:hypothetical protein
MSDVTPSVGPNPLRPRVSTAGRLLLAIEKKRGPALEEIARHSRIGVRRLENCRDGIQPLDPEAQMRLAVTVLALALEHKRKAYTLYGQAQAALRMRDDPDRSHQFYPKERFL